MSKKRGRPPHDDVLTPGEWRVVHAVQHGLSDREIAAKRGISRDAVKFHVENALGKLGLENRAALREWFRAPKDSAIARTDRPRGDIAAARADTAMRRTENGMQDEAALAHVGQISRTVGDVALAEAWYRDVLGLRHLYTYGKLAFFDCGGTRLFLSEQEGGTAESIIYFRVGDMAAAHAALAARGVTFTHAPHRVHTHADGTEEWMAFFADPEGRPLAIMAEVDARAAP